MYTNDFATLEQIMNLYNEYISSSYIKHHISFQVFFETLYISYKELLYRFNKGELDIWEKYEPENPGDKRSLWRIKSKV